MWQSSARRVIVALAAVSVTTAACVTVTQIRAQNVALVTSTFPASADTYVDAGSPTTSYGNSSQLLVDAVPIRLAFLKFAVSGLTEPVTSAKLRLRVRTGEFTASTDAGVVRRMTDTSWSETGVSYADRPDIDGATLADLGAVSEDTWTEVDVTSAVSGNGTYSFGLTSASSDGAWFDSSETGADGPQLVVTTDSGAPKPGPPGGSAVLVGAGDISSCANNNDEATARLLDDIPGTVFTAGDAAYNDGSAANFANCYDPTWGRHQARTRPAPGNHEYRTPGADGYFDYFGAAAGPRDRGYYSYDLGSWHVVALNSNCAQVGGCHAGSAQERWLRADLAGSARSCTVAIWHHPLFTSGENHSPATETRPLFDALYDNDAEVVVAGHNHQYERFAPQDPSGAADSARGIRNFVVGTGGAGLYGFGTIRPNSQARNADTHGVLKLTLKANGYTWEFIPVSGDKFTDSGSGTCH